MKGKLRVVISVTDGVVEAVHIPKGVVVELHDYDIEGCCIEDIEALGNKAVCDGSGDLLYEKREVW